VLREVLIAIVAATVPAQQSHALAPQSRMRRTDAQLCLARPEDEGAMNGQPSWVDVFNATSQEHSVFHAKLSGGDSTCVLLAPGHYTIVASSNVFNGPPSGSPRLPDSKECKSAPRITNLRAGEHLTLDIWPAFSKSNGGGYSNCGWDVLPHGTPQLGNCMVWPNLPSCRSGSASVNQGLTTQSSGRKPATRVRAADFGRWAAHQ
jgi:hypothetical protein